MLALIRIPNTSSPGVSWRIRVSMVCQTQGYMEAAAMLYNLILFYQSFNTHIDERPKI